MRLIDADKLVRTTDELSEGAGFYKPIYEGFSKAIKNQSTIDAVPVVRCKDCEKWKQKEETWLCKNFGYCSECMMDCPGDHFCSYGERKDDATDNNVGHTIFANDLYDEDGGDL